MITSHCRLDREGGAAVHNFIIRHHQGLDPGQESQLQHGDPFVL